MEQQDQSLDAHTEPQKEKQNTKNKKRDHLPVLKKSTSLAKLAAKLTRKRSLKDKNRDIQESADEHSFTSTEDAPLNSDQTSSPTDSGPRSPPMPTPVLVPLTKSSSKSEDSLDSGIYSRQKSCDSVESLESTDSSGNGTECQTRPVMSYTTVTEGISPTDERAHSSMNTNKFDDYWREYQDIRQSTIVQPDDDIDEKRSVTRTDSGDDEDEGEWLRQAGLADLVTAASLSQGTASQTDQSADGNSGARLSTDSLTSMTILSTLTRPQREAVLRRITSFNRAQKSRRRPKPHINAVFTQDLQGDDKGGIEGMDEKPPLAPPAVEEKDSPTGEKVNKSTSLPPNMTGFCDPYPRRYSEIHQRPVAHMSDQIDGSFLNSSLLSSYSTSSLHTSHIVKLDRKGYQRKEALDSIIASEPPGGIETLSIQSRSADDPNWQSSDGNFAEDSKSVPVSYSETADQENLPNFSLVKDRLGITRISDLSPPDIRKVQSLALIELTALFDLHNIDLKRRKGGKAKIKETGLFGIALTTLLEWDQKRQSDTSIRVPLVLQEIITFVEKNGLNDEGILRVPGSALRIKNLKQELEQRFSQSSPIILLDPNAGWSEARTNDVAALLKQFLRELPNPLLSSEYIDAFQSCDLIPDRKQQLQALNLLIILLNDVHRDSLKLLLKFLGRVVAKEEGNKMSLNNVAMIMAPNLFMARKSTKRGDLPSIISASQDVKHAAGTSNIVRMLIKYHKLLWTVPTFMLTQVRNMNKAEHSSKKHHGQSKDKLRIKFLYGKSKEPHSKAAKSPNPSSNEQFEYEVPKGVIRVKVENHSMTSMAVQLDAKTTAGDVIAKFEKQCERAQQMTPDSDITMITSETHALYEVGGNIYERCLDPGTNMHALTKINGDALWVIKKRATT